MFLVEMHATLGGGRPFTDDEITDLIAAMIDDLDHLPVEPSVGTRRIGDDLEVTVEVAVDRDEEFDALSFGVTLIKAAFHAAGIGTAGVGVPRDLRSRVVPMQAV